jgi:AraC-like DNA-binding protein
MARVRALVESPLAAVRDIACRSGRSGPGELRGGEGTHLVLVRHGAFTAHVGRQAHVADVCTALVSWADTEYRISHPGHHGDDCLVLELGPALVDEVMAPLANRRVVELALSPRLQLAAAAFGARVLTRTIDMLAREEHVLELLAALIGPVRAPRHRAGARRLAGRAVEILHRDLAANPSIASIAGELGCSPFHLMHVMRSERGHTLRGYRLAARVGAALHRLAAGETDLSRLALELGFASHSHLTDTCVRLLGAPPSTLRRGLRSFPEAVVAPPP